MTIEATRRPTARSVPGEAWVLWILSALFLLRVIGQVLVQIVGVTFLPPPPEWYSGLLPYPLLLPVQIVILIGMARVNSGVTGRRGFFTTPHPRLGRFLRVAGVVYVAVMVVRYFVSGQLHPERRFWPPGSIPIVFHFVLAGYLFVLSRLARRPIAPDPLLVNDIHSQLNPTRVAQIVAPRSLEELQRAIRAAAGAQQAVCTAGGRHAMGGQQFAAGAVLLDTRRLTRVLKLDGERGLVEVEAGIQWPDLVARLVRMQEGCSRAWGIRQKQSGADRLCLGGALSANVHGRGLRMKPIIDDVESFVLVGANGQAHRCSRSENPELFRLAIGGYGLFGVIYSVTLRLAPRCKLQRVVEIRKIDGLMPAFEQRIRDGFMYGDFQFAIDEGSPLYLRRGVFSCYRPVPPETPMTRETERASERDWLSVVLLAHREKSRAYDLYTNAYLSTNGKLYWSDTHQLGAYVDGYHGKVDARMHARVPATEVITEIYVPRSTLVEFMDEVRADFRQNGVNLIYGTIRLVERDDESFLAWAREPYACVIFNLHTEHTAEGERHSAAAFRRLIDMGSRRGGSYYLTYHRYATREQVERCYPQLREFLRLKTLYDPEERFQSDWYRHHRQLFA